MEVRVGRIGWDGLKSIAIRPSSSVKTTWMDHVTISINEHWATEEELTRVEHFLKEKVQSFHRGEAIGGAPDTDKEGGKKKKWVYVLLFFSTLWSAFVVWCILYYR